MNYQILNKSVFEEFVKNLKYVLGISLFFSIIKIVLSYSLMPYIETTKEISLVINLFTVVSIFMFFYAIGFFALKIKEEKKATFKAIVNFIQLRVFLTILLMLMTFIISVYLYLVVNPEIAEALEHTYKIAQIETQYGNEIQELSGIKANEEESLDASMENIEHSKLKIFSTLILFLCVVFYLFSFYTNVIFKFIAFKNKKTFKIFKESFKEFFKNIFILTVFVFYGGLDMLTMNYISNSNIQVFIKTLNIIFIIYIISFIVLFNLINHKESRKKEKNNKSFKL